MTIFTKEKHLLTWLSAVFGTLLFFFGAIVNADNSSWMEDNAYRFRNNTLKTLSLPASHDAGMYSHDVELFEIGVNDLLIDVKLTTIIGDLGYAHSQTGVVEGDELLDIFDELMGVVRAIDNLCIDYILDTYCLNFGLEELVWGWVGEYYELATGKPGELSITQNLDLYGQLSSGIRMFDLRPKWQRGDLYLQHSQANIDDVGGELNFIKSLKVLDITLASISVEAGGEVKSFSTTGPKVDDVLADVRQFMLEGHREFIVLDFSHFWAGYNGENFTQANYNDLVNRVRNSLGDWLLTEDDLPVGTGTAEERLADARLADLLGLQGRVLAMFDTSDIYLADLGNGIWPNNINALQGDGQWANKDDYEELRSVLQTDFIMADSERFELWWTLTCQEDKALECSVRELADKVNPHLSDFVYDLTIPNENGNTLNEIWVDFAEQTTATEIAIWLNPLAIDIDIKPANNHNPVNPRAHGVIWVAMLSDTETPLDALQIDIPTVSFGPDGAKANHHNVKDVNNDGLADLLLRFKVTETGIECGNTMATVTGKTYGGKSVLGIGSINTVGCNFQSGEMNRVSSSDLGSDGITTEVKTANQVSDVNTDDIPLSEGTAGVFHPMYLSLLILLGYMYRRVN